MFNFITNRRSFMKYLNKILLSIAIVSSSINAMDKNNPLGNNTNDLAQNDTTKKLSTKHLINNWEPTIKDEQKLKVIFGKFEEITYQLAKNLNGIFKSFTQYVMRCDAMQDKSKKQLKKLETDILEISQKIGEVNAINTFASSSVWSHGNHGYSMSHYETRFNSTLARLEFKEIIKDIKKPTCTSEIKDVFQKINIKDYNELAIDMPTSAVQYASISNLLNNINDKNSTIYEILYALNNKSERLSGNFKTFKDMINQNLVNITEMSSKLQILNNQLKYANTNINKLAKSALYTNNLNKYYDACTCALKANLNFNNNSIPYKMEVATLDFDSDYIMLTEHKNQSNNKLNYTKSENNSKSNNELAIQEDKPLSEEADISTLEYKLNVLEKLINKLRNVNETTKDVLINIMKKLLNFITINKALLQEYPSFQKAVNDTINDIDSNVQIVLNNNHNITNRINIVHKYETGQKLSEISTLETRRLNMQKAYGILKTKNKIIEDQQDKINYLRSQNQRLVGELEKSGAAPESIREVLNLNNSNRERSREKEIEKGKRNKEKGAKNNQKSQKVINIWKPISNKSNKDKYNRYKKTKSNNQENTINYFPNNNEYNSRTGNKEKIRNNKGTPKQINYRNDVRQNDKIKRDYIRNKDEYSRDTNIKFNSQGNNINYFQKNTGETINNSQIERPKAKELEKERKSNKIANKQGANNNMITLKHFNPTVLYSFQGKSNIENENQ